MNDDGLNGIVIGKLFKLGNDLLGRKNHAVKFNHGNLGAETGKRFFIVAAKTQIHQRKHRDHEQHEQPAAHQEPNPNPRTPFSHNQTSVAPDCTGNCVICNLVIAWNRRHGPPITNLRNYKIPCVIPSNSRFSRTFITLSPRKWEPPCAARPFPRTLKSAATTLAPSLIPRDRSSPWAITC